MLPSTIETWSVGLGIDWMTPDELKEAIPPPYTEYIGRRLLEVLERTA
jgi:DNA (cytosine-5)-methyltransferase 1